MFCFGTPLRDSRNRRTFKKERCLLPCAYILLGASLCRKLSYHLIQSLRYNQVLTGILPYDSNNPSAIARDITGGKRPSRPTDPSQNQWLQDPVWNVITAGWRDVPKERCGLPDVYRAFLTAGQQEVQNIKRGDLSAQNEETS